MISSGETTKPASGGGTKPNVDYEARKDAAYDNLSKTINAYTGGSITVNSADDASKYQTKVDRNSQLLNIKNEAEKIYNDSSLSAKEKAYELSKLNGDATGTIVNAYASMGDMNSVYNFTDAINNTVAAVDKLPTFNTTGTENVSKYPQSVVKDNVGSSSEPNNQYKQYVKDGYITYYDQYDGNTIKKISETEFNEGLLSGEQQRVLEGANLYNLNTTPGYRGDDGGSNYAYKDYQPGKRDKM